MDQFPKLYYFDIPGKGEPIRLACQYANHPLNDIRLNKDEFLRMREAGKLPFGQLPVLEVSEGVFIGQSAAIMRYIGKKTGLYPTDDVTAAIVDSLIDHEIDLFTGLAVSRYKDRYGFGILEDENLLRQVRSSLNTEILPRHLRFLENFLEKSSTGWLADTPRPSIADFILVPRLEWLIEPGTHDGISTSILDIYPKLKNLMSRFREEVKNI